MKGGNAQMLPISLRRLQCIDMGVIDRALSSASSGGCGEYDEVLVL